MKKMRYTILVFFFATALLGCSSTKQISAGGGRIDPGTTLEFVRLSNMVHVPQTQSNWCWGATLASVVNALQDLDLRACDIVSNAFGSHCCASRPACNTPNSLYAFDTILAPFGIGATVINGWITWDLLAYQLRHDRPVLLRVESPLGQGHFINIVGYDVRRMGDGRISRSVVVSDPMYGYYYGRSNDIGYSATWEKLQEGMLYNYHANWTHTVVFNK